MKDYLLNVMKANTEREGLARDDGFRGSAPANSTSFFVLFDFRRFILLADYL